jgi:hypothetical protein
MDNVQEINNCINTPSLQTYRSSLHLSIESLGWNMVFNPLKAATVSLNILNRLVFITGTWCVSCEVQTELLYSLSTQCICV